VAATQLGLEFIGIEMDEHYLKEAIARTKAALAQDRRVPRKQKSPDAFTPGLFPDY
jgi:DNA modification methylase